MYTFVLVHGSWHDGSAWQPVIQHLERYGHRAFGPTIADHGKGSDKNVNHADCTQSTVDFIGEHQTLSYHLANGAGIHACRLDSVYTDWCKCQVATK